MNSSIFHLIIYLYSAMSMFGILQRKHWEKIPALRGLQSSLEVNEERQQREGRSQETKLKVKKKINLFMSVPYSGQLRKNT